MNNGYVSETEALTKRYGALEAVRALDLRVESHGITGFLGRNGAGKSSTLRMLLGMIGPTSGTGAVLGMRIDDAAAGVQMRRRIAYVGEDKQMYGYMTVEQTIRFTRSFYSDWHESAAQRRRRAGAAKVAERRLPLFVGTGVDSSCVLLDTICSLCGMAGPPVDGSVARNESHHTRQICGWQAPQGWCCPNRLTSLGIVRNHAAPRLAEDAARATRSRIA